MGNTLQTKADKSGGWSFKDGCTHYTDETLIAQQKWKTVPMTEEEAKKVYMRMLSATSKIAYEATHSFDMKRPKAMHECIEVTCISTHLV